MCRWTDNKSRRRHDIYVDDWNSQVCVFLILIHINLNWSWCTWDKPCNLLNSAHFLFGELVRRMEVSHQSFHLTSDSLPKESALKSRDNLIKHSPHSFCWLVSHTLKVNWSAGLCIQKQVDLIILCLRHVLTSCWGDLQVAVPRYKKFIPV